MHNLVRARPSPPLRPPVLERPARPRTRLTKSALAFPSPRSYSLLCRPHGLLCGHTFCAPCIFDHARLSPAREVSCPTCRAPLVMSPPALLRQLSSYVDKVREGIPGVLGGESLDEWHARQAAWDERAAEDRKAHGRNPWSMDR